VGASVVASVLFGFVYFVPALLGDDFSEWETVSWRVILTVPFMALLFFAVRAWPEVAAALRMLRARPALILVLLLNASLLGLQLWLFAWAPKTGHGLEVALGYLLMPLVMVLAGVVLHREKLGWLRLAAVAAAVLGVSSAVLGGGLSWSTFAVALGYPIYFAVRRAFGVDTPGAMWIELVLLLPVCGWLALGPGSQLATGGQMPWLVLVLFGAVSALALTLYVVASRLLTFSLFGLLSYVEPIVLVVVALVLLRESIHPSEYALYAGIGSAVVLLMIEGARSLRRG
jgi:chloramphenicol-sensitive protein RarD